MKNTPFLKELTEARLYQNAADVKGKSAEELADVVYLIIMMIEVIRNSGYSSWSSNYASQTMGYVPYDNMHYSGTDLANLLAVLSNQDTFNDKIKANPRINIPLFQLNRYLGSVRSSSKSNNEDATFFWRLEDYLRLYSKPVFRQLRRDIGNWNDLTYTERTRIVLLLRGEFDKKSSSVDIYLWFKQTFRLKESVNESIDPNKKYRLRIDPKLGDYSGSTVQLLHFDGEFTSPRSNRAGNKQYYVSWGPSQFERDWIDADLLTGAAQIDESKVNEASLPIAYNKTLNLDLWTTEGELHEDVKHALAKIANRFSEFIDVKQIKILDYVITGSNCAYNYTSQSDIDLHVIVDTSGLGTNPLADPFLQAKKNLWNTGHDITVKGYTVELYAEDVNNSDVTPISSGTYSILHDKWLKKPSYENITTDDFAVVAKAQDVIHHISTIVANGAEQTEIDAIWAHIKKMRRAGLESGGEFSVENLTFKVLRNYGAFDKLRDYERHREDDELTLEVIDPLN